MSKYAAGTLNDNNVIAREIADLKRQIREANIPSKTQTYNTSSKVSGDTQDLSGIYTRLDRLESRATKLEADVQTAQDAAEKARLPIGAILHMSSKKEPALHGTWTYLGALTQELSDTEIVTLHLYTRTA